MDKQQGSSVKHGELCSIFCNNLNGKIIWKKVLNKDISSKWKQTESNDSILVLNKFEFIKKKKKEVANI